jgi:hypothetical protein
MAKVEGKIKKKRGRKAYKNEPSITEGPLKWPPGMAQTAPKDRIRGDFRFASAASNKTSLAQVKRTIRNLFKRIDVEQAEVTYLVSTPTQAVDTTFTYPGVAIWYKWKGKQQLHLACDRYTTAIGNFRACLETLDGLHKATKYPSVTHDFQVAFHQAGFGGTDLIPTPKPAPVKAPSKAHLNYEHDWQQILEIPDSEIDPLTGYPKDKLTAGRKRAQLATIYHPDKSETCPDTGASLAVINTAVEWVVKLMAMQDDYEIHKAKEEARAEADAINRKKKREEERDARRAKVTQPETSDHYDDDDGEPEKKREPTAEDLEAIEKGTVSDDDLDEDDGWQPSEEDPSEDDAEIEDEEEEEEEEEEV